MKHPNLEDPEFYTEMTSASQHFVDRFCYVLWRYGPFVEKFDFRRSSMFAMPFIKFKLIATDGDMMRALLAEFPYLTYEPAKDDEERGCGFTDPDYGWEVGDSTYGDGNDYKKKFNRIGSWKKHYARTEKLNPIGGDKNGNV